MQWAATSLAVTASRRSPAPRSTSTTSAFPGCCTAGRSGRPIACGRIRRDPPALRSSRLHRRRLPRHPRPQPGRAHRRRSALPRRARRPPRRRADPPACARGPRTAARGARRHRLRRAAARLRPAERSPTVFKSIAINKGNLEAGFAVADAIVEGEYRRRPPGARLHRDERRDRGARRTAASRSTGRSSAPTTSRRRSATVLGLPAESRARRAGGDRRRLRRQGRVPVDHRRACLPAGAESPAGR